MKKEKLDYSKLELPLVLNSLESNQRDIYIFDVSPELIKKLSLKQKEQSE